MKHLLIDLDGTLLESHDLWLRLDFIRLALREFARHGSWLRSVRALRAVRRAIETTAAFDVNGPTNEERAGLAFAREMGLLSDEGSRLLGQVMLAVFPKLERHFYPVPGAAEFLAWARERYALTLATNPVWPEALVLLRLKWAGIDAAIFERITHAGVMHACKPTENYYREVLAKTGLAAEDCLLVGDDHRKDLPAVRAGIPVYILSTEPRHTAFERLEGARAEAWHGSFPALRAMLTQRSTA